MGHNSDSSSSDNSVPVLREEVDPCLFINSMFDGKPQAAKKTVKKGENRV